MTNDQSSTLILTLLLLVGLFFFIRASVKERIQQLQFKTATSPDSLLSQLESYFDQRAYQVASRESSGQQQVIWQGTVRPSWFLAIFLTVLATLGLLCLGLVLSFLYPPLGNWPLGLLLLAPGAGIFYWRGASRVEEVKLQIESLTGEGSEAQCLVTVMAHRDELRQLQETLPLGISR